MQDCGIPTMDKTRLTWVLIDWKVQVIRRPIYAEKILARTWSKDAQKFYAFRDFEIQDEQGNIIVKAMSKWVLINIDTEKLERVNEEILSKYKPELEKFSFGPDEVFEKLKEQEHYEREADYTVKRGDIDVNKHMHNINYLDLANEALPDEIYKQCQLNNVRITYKREIKLGEVVKCKYSFVDGKHIVVVKNNDESVLHALIELY